MADISQYLAALTAQKNQLAENLAAMGVEVQQSEKLNTLVPKVLDIKQGSDFAVEGYYKDGYFYEDENFTREIEPDYTKFYTDLATSNIYSCDGVRYTAIYTSAELLYTSLSPYKRVDIGFNLIAPSIGIFENNPSNSSVSIVTDVETCVKTTISGKGRTTFGVNKTEYPDNEVNAYLGTPQIQSMEMLGTLLSILTPASWADDVVNYDRLTPSANKAWVLNKDFLWTAIEFGDLVAMNWNTNCTKYASNLTFHVPAYRSGTSGNTSSGLTTKKMGTVICNDLNYIFLIKNYHDSTIMYAYNENFVKVESTPSVDPLTNYVVNMNYAKCGDYTIFGGGISVYNGTGYKNMYAVDENLVISSISDANTELTNSATVTIGGITCFGAGTDRAGTTVANSYGVAYDENLVKLTSVDVRMSMKGNTRCGYVMPLVEDERVYTIDDTGSSPTRLEYVMDVNCVETMIKGYNTTLYDWPTTTATSGIKYGTFMGQHFAQGLYKLLSDTEATSGVYLMKRCYTYG